MEGNQSGSAGPSKPALLCRQRCLSVLLAGHVQSVSISVALIPIPLSACSLPLPQRRPLCFFIYLTTRLKSFISQLENSSSLRFFFFLFFHLPNFHPPCFELLPVCQFQFVCRGSLFDAAVLPPISVAAHAVINFPLLPGIRFPSSWLFPLDPSTRRALFFHAAISAVEPSIDIPS